MGMKIDTRGQKEVAQAYTRLNKRMSAGKGDAPRNCFSDAFRNNYDRVFRRSERRVRKGVKSFDKATYAIRAGR